MTEKSNNRLVAFIYILLRDHLTFGEIEKILKEKISDECCDFKLSQFDMACYSDELAKRILQG